MTSTQPTWRLVESEADDGDTVDFSKEVAVPAVENELHKLGLTPDSFVENPLNPDVQNRVHWDRKLAVEELVRLAQAFDNLGLSRLGSL
jgi:hypothetical protein